MKTKMLTSALVAALVLTGAAAAADLTAKPSVHHVYLDGQPIAPAGYEIEDSNYFKLRDLAAVLNGTGKQFNVSWDEAKASIALTSSQAYTAVGGELAPGDGAVKTAKPSTATVYKDGAALPLTGYEVADNNYYKLRDAAAAFGVEVKWDEATQRVDLITTDGSAEAPAPEQPSEPVQTPEYQKVISPQEYADSEELRNSADAVRVTLHCKTYGVGDNFVVGGIYVQFWQVNEDGTRVKVADGTSDKNGDLNLTFDSPIDLYGRAFQWPCYQYSAEMQGVEGSKDESNFNFHDIKTLLNDTYMIFSNYKSK